MEDLTLDICILISGSGIGDECYHKDCETLMEKMLYEDGYYIAIDNKGKIEIDYYSQDDLSRILESIKGGPLE